MPLRRSVFFLSERVYEALFQFSFLSLILKSPVGGLSFLSWAPCFSGPCLGLILCELPFSENIAEWKSLKPQVKMEHFGSPLFSNIIDR